jgi:hypothetical protein
LQPALPRQPLPEGYYLQDFERLRDTVLEHDCALLAPEEHSLLERFAGLPLAARRLALRLQNRRPGWHRLSRLDYAEIGDPAIPAAGLAQAGLADIWRGEPEETESVVATLEAAACRRWLGEPAPPSSTRSPELHALLVEHLATHPEVLAELLAAESWVRLSCRDLFDTLCLLFFGNPHQGLQDVVISAVGNLVYPPVPVSRVRLFASREARRDCESALALRSQLLELREAGLGLDEMCAAARLALPRLKDPDPGPEPGHRLWRRQLEAIVALAADTLEREGQPAEALPLWEALDTPGTSSRRREGAAARLLVLTQRHGDADACRDRCRTVLAEPAVYSPAFRRATARRLARLDRSAGVTPTPAPVLQKAPEWQLTATRLPDRGNRSRWQHDGDTECDVEDLVLHHRLSTGTLLGGHFENALPRALLGLLFWGEIYRDLPGRFLHAWQATPLDWGGPEFAAARRPGLESILEDIRAGGALARATHRLEQSMGQVNPCLDWRYPDGPTLLSVIQYWTPAALATVLERMLSNLRHWRQGFPDLTLIDPDGLCFIEVKGPGDRLSEWQEEWHSLLLEQGMRVEVCRVREG